MLLQFFDSNSLIVIPVNKLMLMKIFRRKWNLSTDDDDNCLWEGEVKDWWQWQLAMVVTMTVTLSGTHYWCCSDSSSSQALTAQSQTFLRPDTPNNASGTGEGRPAEGRGRGEGELRNLALQSGTDAGFRGQRSQNTQEVKNERFLISTRKTMSEFSAYNKWTNR